MLANTIDSLPLQIQRILIVSQNQSKAIPLANNHSCTGKQPNQPIRSQSRYDCIGVSYDLSKMARVFFNQSQCSKANPKQIRITFDTKLKKKMLQDVTRCNMKTESIHW